MSALFLMIVAAAFAGAWLGAGYMRSLARRRGMLDVPNARSSHTVPTPRGGGVAIAVAVLGSIAALFLVGGVEARVAVSLLVCGLAVSAIGYLDDRVGVSAPVRLTVHTAASAVLVVAVGSLPPQPVGNHLADLGIAGSIVAGVSIVWGINLFNFMDGIDGIAASEAVFMALAGAITLAMEGADPVAIAAFGCIACASLGFLIWNWAPARIFMGDVGSGFLGYIVAAGCLWSSARFGVPLWTWVIFGSLFIADATTTLVRRMLRGDAWHEAHRSHAYQWLARRWRSHARVTALLIAINVCVLLPIGVLSVVRPEWSAQLALVTLAGAVAAVLAADAGRAESGSDNLERG